MCRPYGWNGFSHSGRPQGSPLRRFSAAIQNGASGRPRPTKGESLQSGRVRTPAPTADAEASCPFVGAGHWPARQMASAIPEPTLIRLAYARHLLPGREKAFGRLIAAPTNRRERSQNRAAQVCRPYGELKRRMRFSRRGRSQTGPREGHTPGWLLSAFGRFTFSPSPTSFKKFG